MALLRSSGAPPCDTACQPGGGSGAAQDASLQYRSNSSVPRDEIRVYRSPPRVCHTMESDRMWLRSHAVTIAANKMHQTMFTRVSSRFIKVLAPLDEATCPKVAVTPAQFCGPVAWPA